MHLNRYAAHTVPCRFVTYTIRLQRCGATLRAKNEFRFIANVTAQPQNSILEFFPIKQNVSVVRYCLNRVLTHKYRLSRSTQWRMKLIGGNVGSYYYIWKKYRPFIFFQMSVHNDNFQKTNHFSRTLYLVGIYTRTKRFIYGYSFIYYRIFCTVSDLQYRFHSDLD